MHLYPSNKSNPVFLSACIEICIATHEVQFSTAFFSFCEAILPKSNKNTVADDLSSSIIQNECVDMVIIISNLTGRLHGEWIAIIAAIINARFITILKYSCASDVRRMFHDRITDTQCD